MARGTTPTLKLISTQLDEIAVKYNKTKDPGLRDQWFKLLQMVPLPEHLQPRKERT